MSLWGSRCLANEPKSPSPGPNTGSTVTPLPHSEALVQRVGRPNLTVEALLLFNKDLQTSETKTTSGLPSFARLGPQNRAGCPTSTCSAQLPQLCVEPSGVNLGLPAGHGGFTGGEGV